MKYEFKRIDTSTDYGPDLITSLKSTGWSVLVEDSESVQLIRPMDRTT